MRHLISLALAAFLLSPHSQAATVQVYILAGQSNANIAVESGINSTMTTYMGAGNFELVRSTHNGSALSEWTANGQRHSHYMDDLALLVARIDAIESAGDEAVFGGLIWMQGESNVYYPGAFSLYTERFNDMLGFYQQDLGLSQAPSYTVGVIDANPDPAYDSQINRADVDAFRDILFALGGASNGGSVDTRGMDRVDLWHLTHGESVSLGNAFALDIMTTNMVPEPATAALALLATGLLIRRRR